MLTSILKDVGIPNIAVVAKARRLRLAYASQPGDVVVLDLFAEGSHLVVDVVVKTAYRNTILQGSVSIPGCATKHAHDKKLYADKISA